MTRTNVRPHDVLECARTQCSLNFIIADGGQQQDDGFSNTFIMTSKSDQVTLQTASPPDPPSNLGVGATTCNSIQVTWDPPKERGMDIIGKRI
jgi:hypothetical protein